VLAQVLAMALCSRLLQVRVLSKGEQINLVFGIPASSTCPTLCFNETQISTKIKGTSLCNCCPMYRIRKSRQGLSIVDLSSRKVDAQQAWPSTSFFDNMIDMPWRNYVKNLGLRFPETSSVNFLAASQFRIGGRKPPCQNQLDLIQYRLVTDGRTHDG